MKELTVFKSIFSNATTRGLTFENWDKFEEALFGMSKVPGFKLKRGERHRRGAAPLISPAKYKPNTTRANDNVTHWSSWTAIDIDNYEGSFQETLEMFKEYRGICYSSASSTKEHPKFRIVLNLSKDIPADKIRHFWFALNKEFNDVSDPQTKDLSRMYYVPAEYPDAFNFIFRLGGSTVINPDVLMAKTKYVEPPRDFLSKLPEDVQRAVIKQRKQSLTNNNFQWTSYQDCPFVNRKLLREYQSIAFQDGTGRYGLFYKIMTSIAGNAIRQKYPITPFEIAELMSGIDLDFGARYQKRPLQLEAARAISFIIRNT